MRGAIGGHRPRQRQRPGDTVEIIGDLPGPDRHLAFEFLISFYLIPGIVVKTKLALTKVEKGDIGYGAYGKMSQFFMMDLPGRIPGDGLYDGGEVHSQRQEFRHTIENILHRSVHAMGMDIRADGIWIKTVFDGRDGL